MEDSGELSWTKNVSLSYLPSNMLFYNFCYKGYEFILLLKRLSTFLKRNFSNPKLVFSKIFEKIG